MGGTARKSDCDLRAAIEAKELIGRGETPDTELLWEVIKIYEGRVFQTTKGLNFTYTVKGGELFVDRKEKSITRSSVEKAYNNMLSMGNPPVEVSGPKKLGVFGASYIYPVFVKLGLINRPERKADSKAANLQQAQIDRE